MAPQAPTAQRDLPARTRPSAASRRPHKTPSPPDSSAATQSPHFMLDTTASKNRRSSNETLRLRPIPGSLHPLRAGRRRASAASVAIPSRFASARLADRSAASFKAASLPPVLPPHIKTTEELAPLFRTSGLSGLGLEWEGIGGYTLRPQEGSPYVPKTEQIRADHADERLDLINTIKDRLSDECGPGPTIRDDWQLWFWLLPYDLAILHSEQLMNRLAHDNRSIRRIALAEMSSMALKAKVRSLLPKGGGNKASSYAGSGHSRARPLDSLREDDETADTPDEHMSAGYQPEHDPPAITSSGATLATFSPSSRNQMTKTKFKSKASANVPSNYSSHSGSNSSQNSKVSRDARFRAKLLDRDEGYCVLTGEQGWTDPEKKAGLGLQAAHIFPFSVVHDSEKLQSMYNFMSIVESDATMAKVRAAIERVRKDKTDPANGMLVSAKVHSLWDGGHFALRPIVQWKNEKGVWLTFVQYRTLRRRRALDTPPPGSPVSTNASPRSASRDVMDRAPLNTEALLSDFLEAGVNDPRGDSAAASERLWARGTDQKVALKDGDVIKWVVRPDQTPPDFWILVAQWFLLIAAQFAAAAEPKSPTIATSDTYHGIGDDTNTVHDEGVKEWRVKEWLEDSCSGNCTSAGGKSSSLGANFP